MLRDFGSLGYQAGAVGVVAFTFCYLVAVRWWTDWLGRVIASVLFTTSGVLIVTAIRQLRPDLEGPLFVWRAVFFCGFGITIWGSLITFVWSQYFAPRVRYRATQRKIREKEDIS